MRINKARALRTHPDAQKAKSYKVLRKYLNFDPES
jgi:hypothetical protein